MVFVPILFFDSFNLRFAEVSLPARQKGVCVFDTLLTATLFAASEGKDEKINVAGGIFDAGLWPDE